MSISGESNPSLGSTLTLTCRAQLTLRPQVTLSLTLQKQHILSFVEPSYTKVEKKW